MNPFAVVSLPLKLRPGQLEVPLEDRLPIELLNGLAIGLFLLLNAAAAAAAAAETYVAGTHFTSALFIDIDAQQNTYK